MNPTQSQPSWADDPLWYKDAIIYQLHVKAFRDSNGDGIGDFQGLREKLDYVSELGVNTIWLLPFYPSPMRDDGYDIADYRNIYSDYGTRRDFRSFVREAHRRGLRIITELVINHTSDQHPWFQAARSAPPGSAKRNYYVWSDSDRKFPETRIIFTDTESSNWAWDPVAGAYYWHRFFSHQPDLNHNNPEVVKAVTRVMRFWLDMGVDGLRLDAIPYLCVREGTHNENLPETHAVLKQMRAVVDAHYRGRMFLAEANQWPEDVREYFGDGDECHMAYHFPVMPRMYMAIAQEDRHPVVEIMRQTPDIPETCQWAMFLRNHDELTLEMVTDRERDYMYRTYAAESRMRVNVGIRRRLAPLMDNNIDKIKLMNSLLMSMPGSPIVYYGDELGMGDNFFLGDRNGVRTPMQWSPDRNAGFSGADPQRLYLPPIMDPVYGYQAVNVESQARDPSSLLNWMRHLIAVRKSHQAFGRGRLRFLYPGNRKILAYLRETEAETILCVANLARSAQPVELDLREFRGRLPVEMMGHTVFPPIGDLPYLLTLPGYGVYWFRLETDMPEPYWHEERLAPIDLPVLVLVDGWEGFVATQTAPVPRERPDRLAVQLEEEVLPRFLPGERWFAAKGAEIERVRLEERAVWKRGADTWLLAWLAVSAAGLEPQRYFAPLSIVWGEDDDRIRGLLPRTLAKVRQRARPGVLCDALADAAFCGAVVEAMGEGERIEFGAGRLTFTATRAFADIVGDTPETWTVRQPGAGSTNTTLILNDRLFLKGCRLLRTGINPELELGRFLTEVSPFENTAPLAGALEYEGPEGEVVTLAVLQGMVPSQGDAWSYTLNYLDRFAAEVAVGALEPEASAEEIHAPYLHMMETLGRRTGELHRALSAKTGDPAFDPEPIGRRDLERWGRRLRAELRETLRRLRPLRRRAPKAVAVLAERCSAAERRFLERLDALLPAELAAAKIRHHGDYHLGQVLVSENDFYIVDFEGEPARALAERRAKGSPLRDVAGLLRSLAYAADSGLRDATEERPVEREQLEPLFRDWERAAAGAFREAYSRAMQGCAALPESPHDRHLTELFVLEKALYEVRYELDNRPDWVGIPLTGLIAFLEGDRE